MRFFQVFSSIWTLGSQRFGWWFRFAFLFSLLLLALGSLSLNRSVRQPLDDLAYARFVKHTKPSLRDDIVIIGIDEASLGEFGQWPWQRSVHARLLDVLQGTRTKGVFFNVFFTEPAANPEADVALAQALSRSKRVVLPALLTPPPVSAANRFDSSSAGADASGERLLDAVLPIAPFRSAAMVGHSFNPPAADGAIVKTRLDIPSSLGVMHHSLWWLAGEERSPRLAEHQDTLSATPSIAFVGPAGSFPYFSYTDVLHKRVDMSRLDGKFVLVGSNADGLLDHYATPLGYMSSTEIGANVLNSMLLGNFVFPITLAWQVVYEFVSLLALLLLLFWRPRWYMVSFGAFAVANLLLTWVAFSVFFVWISPIVLWISGSLVMLAWSWWQLLRAWRQVQLELLAGDMLDDDFSPLSPLDTSRNLGQVKKLKRIITQMRLDTQEKMSTVQHNRELVSFLSHDLRSPQVNILASIKLYRDGNGGSETQLLEKIEQYATHTLDYAQTLIDLNRSQHDALNLETCHLLYVVEYACEQMSPQAKYHQVVIVIEPVDDSQDWLWVKIDGGLIERAIMNLLSNALRVSQAGGQVVIKFGLEHVADKGDFVVVSVTDFGAGMSDETAELLMSGNGSTSNPRTRHFDGVNNFGIGWRIIHAVVVGRHNGLVEINSHLGQGTTAKIKLPCLPRTSDTESELGFLPEA